MNQKIISLENIKHNLDFFSSFGKKLTIMVKANAYGHGIKEIARALKKSDVKLGVATLQEAQELRKYWDKEILIVEPIRTLEGLTESNFQFCVDSLSMFLEVKKTDLLSQCYIKINVGMNRFGIKYDDSKILKKIAKNLKNERFLGLLIHFSSLNDEEVSKCQYERFLKVKKLFPNANISFGGSGAFNHDFNFDELRVGIGFYGYEFDEVKPIMNVKSQILSIFSLKQGESLGYDGAFVAQRKTKVAVVGIGYGDGSRRDLSGFYVKINGHKCKIIGKICMDCMFVDVTDIVASEGCEVQIEDADIIAQNLKTISYEILTGYSNLRGETLLY